MLCPKNQANVMLISNPVMLTSCSYNWNKTWAQDKEQRH